MAQQKKGPEIESAMSIRSQFHLRARIIWARLIFIFLLHFRTLA
jgi:hypothetical protein